MNRLVEGQKYLTRCGALAVVMRRHPTKKLWCLMTLTRSRSISSRISDYEYPPNHHWWANLTGTYQGHLGSPHPLDVMYHPRNIRINVAAVESL